MELGGFAENENVIDGGYEEFISFNYCLACDYLNAMYMEDFEAIGEIDDYTLEQITYWYTYRMESKEAVEEMIKIERGLLMTFNNRTFVDALIENNIDYLAYLFISGGNNDERLYELNEKYIKKLKI